MNITPNNLLAGSVPLTETSTICLSPGGRYSIFKSGTIGSATEFTLQAVGGTGLDKYSDFVEDGGSVDENYELTVPPSGVIRANLPSAAGTTVLLEYQKVQP
jgi:hypothetical protein